MQGFRGSCIGELSSKQLDIIDVAQEVAAEAGSDVPTVALSWVEHKPGVTSTILGTRTVAHLDANLKALDLRLTPEQVGRLDAVSKPVPNFQADFNANLSPYAAQAGTTMNGVPSKLGGNVPKDDMERW